MALSPKPREAVLAAFHAPGVTLSRGPAGYQDRTKGADAPVVTVRTANTLIDGFLAVYDDPAVPSALTLTPHGIAEGRRIADAPKAAAA